ncbi:MAG: Holliday junction resolvase RuvX [Gammaproteobacteria bacterium]|nr:Holliday junction resolvase RuvX [Gammaproteobacteria bacterium]MCH9763941.1 Holliday junction resolvase RuvX [Gammaproteobacteria bacterium]
MPDPVYLGFDFGYKRIGVAVGQRLTATANPLPTLQANEGVPRWELIATLIKQWQPDALIVGFPTRMDGGNLYVTKPARRFAKALKERSNLPVFLVDERLSTVEARAQLFAEGGYRKLKKVEVDSMAACIILEQWLQESE